tara:strand:+ start:1548 stop:2495 length:948 start_codon:yes stop_codon:yes gene_type:complete
MKINKILITGGFGFLGKKFVEYFLNKNIDVIVMEHPKSLLPNNFPQCEILRSDLTDRKFINELKVKNVEAVLHLAAQSSGPRSFSIPYDDININILGTMNLLEWCVNNEIDRFLFASSFVVYGDNKNKEILSESDYCFPKSIYANSKFSCENILQNWAQIKGIKWNALRMFNVYGPGQDITKSDQGVVGIFMNMLMKSNKVEVKGSLERFRDLIYIDDVIQAWDKCLHGKKYNQIYNVGSGVKTTFNHLIKSIARVLEKENKLELIELDGTPGDLMGCYADLNKINKDLNYEPKFNLSEGLNKMWNWVNNDVNER